MDARLLFDVVNWVINNFGRYPWFVIIGGVGSVAILALTFVLTEFVGLWYLASYILSVLLGWTVAFFLNAKITFQNQARDRHWRRYLHFLTLYSVLGAVNFALVFWLTSIIKLPYLLSIVSVLVPLSLLNFWINRIVVFNYH